MIAGKIIMNNGANYPANYEIKSITDSSSPMANNAGIYPIINLKTNLCSSDISLSYKFSIIV